LQVQHRDYVNRCDAAAHGAILPPELESSFGGVSTVLRSVRDLATGYPGQLLAQRCDDLGNTYGIRIGFKNRVRRLISETLLKILTLPGSRSLLANRNILRPSYPRNSPLLKKASRSATCSTRYLARVSLPLTV
jgi:hypothetical protein